MRRSTFALPIIIAAALSGRVVAQSAGDYVLSCNGTTDYVASSSLLSATNDFTMEAWVNPTMQHEIDPQTSSGIAGCSGEHYAIYPLHGTACWGAGHAGAGFSVGTNGVSVYEHAGDYMPATLVYEGAISGWTHVAVVYRDRVPSLYINGVFVKQGVRGAMAYVHPSAGRAAEGRWVYGGIGGGPWGHFAGMLDDVRIWKGARSAEEVRATMSAAAPAGSDLLVNYDMNRTGAGSGLAITSLTSGNRVSASTFGTAGTPVFTPREGDPQVSRPIGINRNVERARPSIE